MHLSRTASPAVLLALSLLAFLPSGAAQSAPAGPAGLYRGFATVHGQQVPLTLQISGAPTALTAAFLNGPEPERSLASHVTLSAGRLVATYTDYARTLDVTLARGTLTGSFGTPTVRYPVTLRAGAPAPPTCASPRPSPVEGDWEVQTTSGKGETSWQMKIARTGDALTAVIQRIDGDTGNLYGTCTGGVTYLTHLDATGPALYSLTPQPNGTLIVSNMLRADATSNTQQNLLALRPAVARARHLPPPTDPTQQTSMKNPAAPLAFRFPDLAGKIVANTDPRFQGKVVIVAIGGSWCPNCHDEAPFLESLYEKFHSRGLEVVDLSFEEDIHDQPDGSASQDTTRLRAFIDRYHLTYPVLLAGDPDTLNEKLPGVNQLNCWPTSFFLGRDGRVREIHAGFAGPANPAAHQALIRNTTALLEELLAEPVPSISASR